MSWAAVSYLETNESLTFSIILSSYILIDLSVVSLPSINYNRELVK
jgi:hypothetical protein